MPDENQKITARIRTFASDLDAHRQNKGDSKDVKEEKEESVTVTKKTEKIEPPAKKTPSEPATPKTKPIQHFEVKLKEDPEKPKHIPAFHELQKQVKKIQGEPVKKDNSNQSSKPIHTNIGFDATVITDTKNNRKNLILEITKSLTSWFKNATKPKKKKTPKYSVPEANHRKGVIQKATTKTGSIFTADSETLKEHIRLRQKQKEEEAETIWSPYTDTGYNLLPGPDAIQNVKVEFKKQSVPTVVAKPEQTIPPKPLENNGVEDLINARRNLDDKLATSAFESESETPTISPEPEAKTEVPITPNDTVSPTETQPEIERPEAEEQPMPQVIKSTSTNKSLLERFDTNTLTVIVLITIIALVILIFVSKVFIQSINQNTNSSVSKNFPVESLIEGNVVENITVTTENVSNLTAVLNNSFDTERSGEISEIAFITTSGDEIAPSYIFDLLNLSVVASMKQSLTSVRFLADNTERSMLLKFVDEATVRGGFLNWENSMPSDFVRIFNLPRNIEGRFVDEKIFGYDIRVLKNDDGDILIYCIVNENTALITQNRTSLEKILTSKFPK